MTETRTSTSRSAIRSLMRPSCGRRFSAMSSRLRIFRRETISAWKFFTSGGIEASTSMPSMR